MVASQARVWSNFALLSTAKRGNMYTVSRDLKGFSAAHRLNKGYEGKCKYLHGHSYRVRVTLTAHELDQYDFVIDFGDIKAMFDDWVQAHWDHVTIVSEVDTTLIDFLRADKQEFFVVPGGANTTCEALGAFLFETFRQVLSDNQQRYTNGVELVEVKLWESNYSHATFTAG